MTTHRHNRALKHPLIGKVCTIIAALALLLTLGTTYSAPTAHATEDSVPFICKVINSGFAEKSDNVFSPTAGNADVTPLSTETLPNGDVTYKFQVSFLGLHSSSHLQTIDTFQIAMPPFVKDVKFSQYGTYEYPNYHGPYGNSLTSRILNHHVTTYIDEDAPEKPTVTAEMPLEIVREPDQNALYAHLKTSLDQRAAAVDDYYKKHAERLKKEFDIPGYQYDEWTEKYNDTYAFSYAATLNGMKALREAGYKAIPGVIIDAGYDYNTFDRIIKSDKQLAELEKTMGDKPKVKSYITSIGDSLYPLGLKVEYTVSADQVKKTPTMPLWASMAWRSFFDGLHYRAEADGSQNLAELGDVHSSFMAIAQPETIQNSEFDRNGLYGTNVGVTAYTGNWYTIGSDITPGTFNYAYNYDLHRNPGETYVTAMADDGRDIAALNPNKPLPPGRPKVRIPEGEQFLNCPVAKNLIASGGGVDVTPITKPLPKEPFPQTENEDIDKTKPSPDGPACLKPEDLPRTAETPETAESTESPETPEEETVHYSFLVSMQAIQAIGDKKKADTFDIELPFEAKDIKFHQIGTYDTSKGYELGNYEANLKTAHYAKFPLEIMKVDEDHDAYAKLKEEYHKRAQILQNNFQAQGKPLTDEEALSQVKQLGMLANQAELNALKAAGVKELPGGIFDTGTNINKFDGEPNFKRNPGGENTRNAAMKYDDKTHGFLISVTNATRPLAVQVDFNVAKKQAEKTPYMAVWAALAWSSTSDGPSFTEPATKPKPKNLYDYDPDSLDHYFSTEQDQTYVANPWLISHDQFDENGLYGTSSALTRYTGKWWEIGKDITQGTFSYSDVLDLGKRTDATYYVAPHDDYRDIAAMHYLEPAPAPEDEQPKLCPPAPGGGGVTPPTPTPAPKADKPSPSPETPDNTGLPRTGVNLALGGSLAAALLLAGVALVSQRWKNLS